MRIMESKFDAQESGTREMFKATCSDCGKECEVPFKPTEGKPVRCQDCFRKARPARNNGGRRRFDNHRSGGFNRNFNSRPRVMTKTTCSSCGKECEVPFKPTQGKPVYCQDCFRNNKEQF